MALIHRIRLSDEEIKVIVKALESYYDPINKLIIDRLIERLSLVRVGRPRKVVVEEE